jgi:hypothetical protein
MAYPLKVALSISSLCIWLNKQHQNGCLLKATLADCRASTTVVGSGNSSFVGGVRDAQARDEDTYTSVMLLDKIGTILWVLNRDGGGGGLSDDGFPFLTCRYATYFNNLHCLPEK